MKNFFIYSAAVLMALPALDSDAATPNRDFAHYQPIVDREPFGAPPAPPPAPVEQVNKPLPRDSPLRYLQVCAFTREDDGSLTVGLLNPKAGLVYYLAVGETAADKEFSVVEADYEKEGVKVMQDGNERWIYNASAPSTSSVASSGSSRTSSSSSKSNSREAILERMRQRRAAAMNKVKTKKYTDEELAKQPSGAKMKEHLQNYQMELIRSGGSKGPVLPVPLTEKSDNQLVNEGVLPPR